MRPPLLGRWRTVWAVAEYPRTVHRPTVPLGYMPADQEPIPYEDDNGKRIDLPHPLFCRFPNQCVLHLRQPLAFSQCS